MLTNHSGALTICGESCGTGTAYVVYVFEKNARKFQEGLNAFLMHSCRTEENLPAGCGFCHIPYDELNMPFPAHLTYCCNCRKQKVPDVLFTTIDLPADAAVIGKGCLIQARYVCESILGP